MIEAASLFTGPRRRPFEGGGGKQKKGGTTAACSSRSGPGRA